MNTLDLHCWIERKDGSIYDPTPIIMEDFIFMFRNISDKTRYYEKYEDDELKDACIKVFDVIKNFEKDNEKKGINMRTLVQNNKYSLPSLCYLNAYYWVQDHKGEGRMKIGKMGWKTNEGNMWWEFG